MDDRKGDVMAALMGSRRRAEQFAAALEAPAPVEQVPPDLRALVDVVAGLRTLEPPAPRPEFSSALREQLMAEAETALAPASPLSLPPRRRGARERRLTAAAAVFTLVGGTAGMAVAAQDALPGDALYPIKRGIEEAQLGAQSDPDDRGRTYLEQASDRLDEAGRLVEEGASTTAIADTVDSFVVQTVAGSDLLLGSYEDQQSAGDVEVLREFTASALERLRTLASLESTPDDVQDELARAALVLQRIDQQAAAACAGCSDLPSLEMPALMAQAAEISRAMEAVRDQRIGNDHPPLGEKVPRTTPQGDTGTQAGAPTPQQGGPAAPPSLGVDGPDGTVLSGPRDALKGVDDATGGLVGKVGDKTEETTRSLTDNLSKTLEDTLGGLTGTGE